MNMPIKVTDEMVEAVAKKRRESLYGVGSWDSASARARETAIRWASIDLTTALAAAEVPVWEPCEPEDIKKGDRLRVEYEEGHACEGVATGDREKNRDDARYFRIQAKVEKAVWPTVPGLYEIEWKNSNRERAYMFGPDTLRPENSGTITREQFEAWPFLIKAIRKIEA